MDRVLKQIDKQIVDDPAKSPFYAPYTKPAPVPPPERDRLAAEAKRAIADGVVPAFQKLRAFWASTYLPACKDDVGAWQLPKAAELYPYLVRLHTTTTLGPDEVHAIGLREVARIRGEMEATKARAGFQGTLKELFAFLRTDERFFFKDGAALLAAYRDLAKRIDPLLVKVFRRLPRTPYGVMPIPEHIAPDTTCRSRSRWSSRTSRRSAGTRITPPSSRDGRSTPRASARRWGSTTTLTRSSVS